jgi:alkanesulfonate monooxygenase SsuD/methylene tetrahydromethanopterin reductase-like flavin-dependent oxidoreductase (luciferase family)
MSDTVARTSMPIVIKPWVFDFNQVPGTTLPDYHDQDVVQRAFDHNLALTLSLEGRGFEGVFYSEHHFLASMSPSPNLLVATLAARTERLKIGVMGNVLPFHQPWRLAEELAMLDYITHGRLEIGVASGVPPEFLFINMPQPEIRPIYTEVLDFLQKSERESPVTFKSVHFDFNEMPIMPRPRKEARRRHWVTVFSEASCRDAARRAFKVCTGFQSVESATVAFNAYRETAAELGRAVGPDDIGIRRQILIADTQAEAEAQHAELLVSDKARMAHMFRAVIARLQKSGVGPSESVKQSGVIDAPAVPRQGAAGGKPPAMTTHAAPVVSEDEYITGTPASVAEQIIDQCCRSGAGNILAFHAPTMTEAQIARNYALWEQVIPLLKKAGSEARLEPAAAIGAR